MAAGAKKASGNEANSVPQVVGYKRNNTTYRSDVTISQGWLLYPVALLLFDWFLYFSHPLGVKWVGNMFARKASGFFQAGQFSKSNYIYC